VNQPGSAASSLLGFGLVLAFAILMVVFSRRKRDQVVSLREIPAFARLKRGIALAVEAGTQLHVSLGHGGLNGPQGASALLGLSMLKRIGRIASVSDRPLIATSGEATLAILSNDLSQNNLRSIDSSGQFDPNKGQLTGLTPFSFAAGIIPLMNDQHVSVTLLAGTFGSEVALITDSAERNGSLTLAGSDNITAQAVLYASAQEPLVGEELYAAGAYLEAGPMHTASLGAQDVVRWIIVLAILLGLVLKFVNIL
jgi:hypothetical protein